MRKFGFVPLTLVARGEHGVVFLSPYHLADDSAKDQFAQIARLVCVAHAATAAVLVLESWLAPIGSDMSGDGFASPSQSPDRREVVVLAGESDSGSRQTILPIVRARDGQFREFGKGEVVPTDSVSGRFARLLPAIPPTRAEQERASLVLAAMGVATSGISQQPNAN